MMSFQDAPTKQFRVTKHKKLVDLLPGFCNNFRYMLNRSWSKIIKIVRK